MKLVSPVMGEEEATATRTVLKAVLREAILVDHDADKVRGALEALECAPVYDGDKTDRDPTAKQLGRFARGSETSRQGALANYPRSGSQRARILELMLESGARGEHGFTREELEDMLHLPANSVRPRVRELIDGGWIAVRRDGEGKAVTRKTKLKNSSEVLEVTAKAVKRHQRERAKVLA